MTNETNSQGCSFHAVIFDLDGVVTKTAVVHAAAWKATFDEFLRSWEKKTGEPFKEFTYEEDYLTYVDGKPRYKGVQSFLESRGINLDFGDAGDGTDKETVCGLGNRKNVKFVEALKTKGAEIYPSTIELIKDLRSKGVRIGVASSSANCQYILQSTGLEDLFETRVDGVVSKELGLKGKPEGDIFVKAAENVGAKPDTSIVVEDAVSGVQAGVNGKFGLVIGIAREHNEDDLKSNGADVVIDDFAGITAEVIEKWFREKNNPDVPF